LILKNTTTTLSEVISDLSPLLYDYIEIENKLLDGSIHKQIIGDAQGYRTFVLLANGSQVATINQAMADGATLILEIDETDYTGFLGLSDWERIGYNNPDPTKVYYRAEVRFDIVGGGD
jgi:hypothetical protein